MLHLDFIQKLLAILGIIVWLIIGYDWLIQRRREKMFYPSRVKLGGEYILLSILAFLLIAGLMLKFLAYRNYSFSVNSDMNHLVGEMFADMAAKLTLLFVIPFIYIKAVEFQLNQSLRHNVIKIIVISFALYLAIFPVVNIGMLNIGVYIAKNLMGINVGGIQHPAFKLLNSPYVGIYPKFVCLMLAAIVSPMIEELFFRGMLQNWILRKTSKPVLSIILASVCFMIVHIPMYHQLPALWLLGVILGWAYWRFGTIWVPILTHIVFNSATLIMWHYQATA